MRPDGALALRSANPLSTKWLMPLFFIGLFLAWEVSIPLFKIPLYVLPPPSLIVAKGWADIPKLRDYTLITGGESLLGFLIAVALAVPLCLSITFSSILPNTLYPLLVSLAMDPDIAVAPSVIS